jgi:excisionase family DNA binding protein
MELEKKFLSMDELSEYIGMSKSFLYKQVHKNEIPFLKVGSRTKFVTEEIYKWILRGRQMGVSLPDLPKF